MKLRFGATIIGGGAHASRKVFLPGRGQKKNVKETGDEKREREQRWREILEELGPDVVRTRFSARMPVWGERYGEKLPSNDFIVAWLAEKDVTSRQVEARRFLLVTRMALFTLIVSCFILRGPGAPVGLAVQFEFPHA